MLEIIVFLLFAILITLLGWWGLIGWSVVALVVLVSLVFAYIRTARLTRTLYVSIFGSYFEKKRLRDQIMWREGLGYDAKQLRLRLKNLEDKN